MVCKQKFWMVKSSNVKVFTSFLKMNYMNFGSVKFIFRRRQFILSTFVTAFLIMSSALASSAQDETEAADVGRGMFFENPAALYRLEHLAGSGGAHGGVQGGAR